MALRATARHLALWLAPGRMADRARRYEQGLRAREGITELAERFTSEHGAQVVAGPFAGLRYPEDRLGEIDAPVAKMTSAYEQETLPVYEQAIRDGITTFIDVGCADGYFAVGFAVAAPDSQVYAYDIADSARAVCSTVAELNGVSDRVHVGEWFDGLVLGEIAPGADTLVLVDIEGDEQGLLDQRVVAKLANMTVLVEVHEFARPGLGDTLRGRFSHSHDVQVFEQQPRNPADYPALAGWPEEDARRALSEYRPADLRWMYFTPKLRVTSP